jgi:zinc protease
VVDAGSILEEEDQLGVAHLVEHMAFNGTEKYNQQEIIAYFESIGMRFGADLNAYTSFDETVYMINFPADDQDILDQTLDVVDQWINHVSFDPEELEKERGVVMEEWRRSQSAEARVREQQRPYLYKDSLYAERVPIGKPELIAGVSRDRVIDFYRKWYHPANTTLVMVGDMDPQEIERSLFAAFSEPAGRPAPVRPQFDIPSHPEPAISIISDPELPYIKMQYLIKQNPRPFITVGDYRMRIIQSLFTVAMNNRFDEINRSPDTPFLEASTFRSRIMRNKDFTVLAANVKPGRGEEAFTLLLTEMEKARRFGFTDQEFELAKVSLMSGIESLFNEENNLSSYEEAEEMIRYVLEDEPVPGLETEYKLYQHFLPQITQEDVFALAQNWLPEAGRVVLINGPEDEENSLPKLSWVEEQLATIVEIPLENDYIESEVLVLLEEVPSPATVSDVTSEEWDKHEIKVFEAENGAKLYVLPTEYRNDEVLFLASAAGGLNIYDDEDYVSAALATPYSSRSGLGALDLGDLERYLTGKNVKLGPYINEYDHGFSGESGKGDLETLFQLLHLRMTSPRFTEDAYQALYSRYVTFIQGGLNDPLRGFFAQYQDLIYEGNFRMQTWSVPRLELWNPARSEEIYRETFSNPGQFDYILVGNVDLEKAEEYFARYIASIPGKRVRRQLIDRGVRFTSSSQVLESNTNTEPKSTVILSFLSDYREEKRGEGLISSMAELVNKRLNEVIREDLSGTYSIGVFSNITTEIQPRVNIQVYFDCEPGREEELIQAVNAVIKDFQENGISAEMLSASLEATRREFNQAETNNSYWMSVISLAVEEGKTPDEYLDWQELLDLTTLEKVQSLANEYFDFQRVVLGKIGPKE